MIRAVWQKALPAPTRCIRFPRLRNFNFSPDAHSLSGVYQVLRTECSAFPASRPDSRGCEYRRKKLDEKVPKIAMFSHSSGMVP